MYKFVKNKAVYFFCEIYRNHVFTVLNVFEKRSCVQIFVKNTEIIFWMYYCLETFKIWFLCFLQKKIDLVMFCPIKTPSVQSALEVWHNKILISKAEIQKAATCDNLRRSINCHKQLEITLQNKSLSWLFHALQNGFLIIRYRIQVWKIFWSKECVLVAWNEIRIN